MTIVSYNDNLKIGGSLFHIQTEYYKHKEQVICNIFRDGRVVKKIPLQIDIEDGIEEMVKEFHFFVLNRLKNPSQIQVIFKSKEKKPVQENSDTKSKTMHIDLLNKSAEEIDRDFCAFLQWISHKKETLILGLKCNKYNGYVSFVQGEPIGFKCGKIIGYEELKSAIEKKPQIIKIIKPSNLTQNKQFCCSLDCIFSNSKQSFINEDNYLIKKGEKLLKDLSQMKGFVSLMVLNNSSNIRWGFQEKHLDIDIDRLQDFCLTKIKKLIDKMPSNFWQLVLIYEKHVLIFDFLKDKSDFLLVVFDCKGNYALAQKKIREAFVSEKN